MVSSLFYLTVRQRLEILALVILLSTTLLFALVEPHSRLTQVQNEGVLKVAMRNSATSFYEGPQGLAGPEYDLARAFAKHLGVELEILTASTQEQLLTDVREGRVAFGAGIVPTRDIRKRFALGPPYHRVTRQVVYRIGNDAPRTPADLLQGSLEIPAGGYTIELLEQLKTRYPGLSWVEHPDMDGEELLQLVWERLIDYTIVSSDELSLNKRFYPELKVAFELGDPRSLMWIFPGQADGSIRRAANDFFAEIRKDGTLDQILERYYGHARRLDYVGTRTFLRHITERLPPFRPIFRKAAREYGLDWRLLAAVGYQESHWDPAARSPTGVRGLMMLTLDTAGQVGVDDRLDPEQSIFGGARYLASVKSRIPERIPEPDRSWMALAAYNVGFGHLEDARKITEAQGADPDKWIDVMERLPLLSQRQWYRYTRHGYARGREPVHYVQNIRSYYDILVWYTKRERGRGQPKKPPPYYLLPPAL